MEIKIVEQKPKRKMVRRDLMGWGTVFIAKDGLLYVGAGEPGRPGFIGLKNQGCDHRCAVPGDELVTPCVIKPLEGQEGSFIISPVMEDEPKEFFVPFDQLELGSLFVRGKGDSPCVRCSNGRPVYVDLDGWTMHERCLKDSVYPLKANGDGTYSYATCMEEVAVL